MNDDWSVPCSDDEEDPTYMPSPETIIALYDRLNKGEVCLNTCSNCLCRIILFKSISFETIKLFMQYNFVVFWFLNFGK